MFLLLLALSEGNYLLNSNFKGGDVNLENVCAYVCLGGSVVIHDFPTLITLVLFLVSHNPFIYLNIFYAHAYFYFSMSPGSDL